MANTNTITTARGTLYVISAPSGAGKTSLVKALVESTDDIKVSVSHTTRASRPGEKSGIHYNFVNLDTFKGMIERCTFLEHAQVFDNYYGTCGEWVSQQLDQGIDVILEIDWQGAQQIRTMIPECISIFILPPSREALEQRLQGRGQDNAEIITRRMRDAINEISHFSEFDYLIINDNFNLALDELRSIIVSLRLRQLPQQQRYTQLLDNLLSQGQEIK